MEAEFCIGDWLVFPRLNRLESNGRTVRLEPKVMQVLVCLAEQPGEVISKEQLLRTVWADTFVTDEVLTRAISELRRVFQDDAKAPHVIETVPKGGYRLIAPSMPPARVPSQPVPRSRKSIIFVLSAVVCAAVVLPFVSRALWNRLTSPRAVAAKVESIAVLPLKNLSGDPAQEYFADGMTEELIADLSKIAALRVISRTSIMQYKGAVKTLPQIARELNVDAVVEGSVLRSGNRVRITAQLIRAATEKHLWGESYERDLGDVFALQRDVAHAIAREIRINTSKEDETRLSQHHDASAAAHESYLKARAEWSKRHDNKGKEALLKSIEYFEEAIRKDPEYALAYAGMADSYIVLADQGGLPPEQAYAKVRWASTKAVEADENLADGHLMLASVKEKDWDWAAAEQEYKRALALNPGLARAHDWYAILLSATKRHADAIAEINRAIELEPLSATLYDVAVTLYCQAHRYDDAMRPLQALQERGGNTDDVHFSRGKIYLYKGMYDRALDEVRAMREDPPSPYDFPLLANALARSGRTREALEIVRKLERESSQSPVDPLLVAMAWAGLNDHDKVLLWLRKGFDAHSPKMMSVAVTPEFDQLQSDPRFQDLVRRVGLPE